MFNTIVGAGSVEAGAASRYGTGSDQMMRLLAAPAPEHRAKHKSGHTKFCAAGKIYVRIFGRFPKKGQN
jgi:hypothetical protein